MQAIAPVTTAQLLAVGQNPLMKLEIYVKGSWVDFGNLYSSEDLVGWWPFDEGAGATAHDKSLNLNDGTLYPTPVLINACDALTDWSSSLGSLSIDTDDKMEGVGSLKDTIASPVATTIYSTQYNPTGSWNWSAKKHILFWLKCDRASTAFTYARLQINDTSNNWRYWNFTFSAGEWTVVKKLLSTGDGESGTPPNLALINRVFISFKAADTTPFYKKIDDLRIDDRPQWVDGKVNKALDFDGEEDWVNCGENVRPVSAISVSAWLRPHAFQVGGAAISSGRNGGILLFYPSGTDVRFYVWTTGWNYITMAQADISLDEWHHFVLTYDQTNLKIFMDGEEKNSGGLSGDITYDGKNFEIGRYSGTGPYFDGLIDEVRIYKRVLTATEIKALAELKSKNYLETISMSLGGAKMTPKPVAGTWSATLFPSGVFHPDHPTSAYKDYLQTEKLIRISIGSTYSGVDYYWQRLIGYMDTPKFSTPDYRVSIKGRDYMKRLQETELRRPNNYWGSTATFNSIASDGLIGSELYAENDAMEIGGAEADNVTNWATANVTFVSLADVGGGSAFVGKASAIGALPRTITNVDVGAATAGKEYRVVFKHRGVGETGTIGVRYRIIQTSGNCFAKVFYPLDTWTTEIFYFTALDTEALQFQIVFLPQHPSDYRIDEISIYEWKSYWDRYYALPGGSTGPYYVTLDGVPVWHGTGDDEWRYTEDAEVGPDPPDHPAKIVYFNINKVVANGVANLVVSYFTQQVAEEVVADLLVLAGLYINQGAALAGMDFDATGVTIDLTWFRAGTNCLTAIKKICELCDYRFYFSYDGTPVFKAKPGAGGADFTFTDPKQISSSSTYQDKGEIKNRIVITGLRQSDTVGKEETMPSDLKGEDSDAGSITAYGERTLTIDNHLFQTQAVIDAMCTSLLAEYKDPKWYATLKMPYKPIPLELGDNIQWEERLSPILNVTLTGIIRDVKIDNYHTTYKCERT